MDKKQARFILRSFRPDGADAADSDFAQALHLAAEDRELGDWLALERAQDAAFSQALSRIEIPETLREEILFGLAAERGEVPPLLDGMGRAFMAALGDVRPPESLRADIFAAMSQGKVVKGPFPWFRIGLPLAAAAGLVLAFLVNNGKQVPAQVKIAPVHIEAIEAGFIKTFKALDFSLEKQNADHEVMLSHLREHGLPCPSVDPIPAGLKNVPSLGCRELVIDGKRGSLVCFNRGADGIVHLIIFRREDFSGDVPMDGKPRMDQSGGWAVASWGAADEVFVLVGDTTIERLAALF